jgi:hypothetical protein
MYTEAYRNDLRDALIEKAGLDQRLVGVALTGSSSTGSEDRWSDIDLAPGVASDLSHDQVISDWTQYMREEHGAVTNVDVVSRATVYRVFLLAKASSPTPPKIGSSLVTVFGPIGRESGTSRCLAVYVGVKAVVQAKGFIFRDLNKEHVAFVVTRAGRNGMCRARYRGW